VSARRALPARRIDQPEPGYFLMRLCKGGWEVPARIQRTETGDWIGTIDGETRQHPDPTEAGVMRIWLSGRTVEAWVYADRDALREWAKVHEPDHPTANPKRPMDAMRLRPVTVPRSIIPRGNGDA
jgi:hypothetical protein